MLQIKSTLLMLITVSIKVYYTNHSGVTLKYTSIKSVHI